MAIRKLGHYSIRTTDLESSRRFYTEVLGLEEGFRPPFPFPGIWLYLPGDKSDYGVVHIIGIDPHDKQGLVDYLGDKDPSSQVGTGTLDHVAFLVEGLQAMRRRLAESQIPFTERTVPSLGLHQVFVTDPSGVTVELNYPASEATEPAATH